MIRKQRLRALFFLVASLFVRHRWRLAPALLAVGLGGCASGDNLVSDVVRGVFTHNLGSATDPTIGARLNPEYRYLRVEVAGRPPALLVLGYVDAHADGEIEVWYSAKREVIKIQNGRIVATFGLETDWRAVRLQPARPLWAGEGPDNLQFERRRDEMPGYRYAITEQMETRQWPGTPPQGVSMALGSTAAQGLQWFREVALRSTGPDTLPPAWYALGPYNGRDTIVYSEQCLTPAFCLRMLRWPVQGASG